MTYQLIIDEDSHYFQKQLNAALLEGWKLHGPTTVTALDETLWYAQALTLDQ